MKKIIIMVISIIFLFTGMVFADGKREYKKNKNNDRYERVYPQDHPMHHSRGNEYGHFKNGRNRRYDGYIYERHYTWKEWHRNRHHPRYTRGRYHHDDNGYLMFSFCNWKNNQKICFSVGID